MTPEEREVALAAVNAEIAALASGAGIPASSLPWSDRNQADQGDYWVELNQYDDQEWQYELWTRQPDGDWVLCESQPPSPIVEEFFRDLTYRMAAEAECQNRRPGEDPRRQQFALQVELLERLNQQWAARRREEQAWILMKSPFVDGRNG